MPNKKQNVLLARKKSSQSAQGSRPPALKAGGPAPVESSTCTAAYLPVHLYQGSSCIRGHSGIRYRSTNHCIECHVLSSRLYRQRHPDRSHAQSRRYRLAHQDELREFYRQLPAEYKRLKKAARRAREKGQHGKLSKDIGARLLELQRGRCAGCRGGL